MPQFIFTDKAPKPGCYSQAVSEKIGDSIVVFLSGQTGNVPGVEGEPVIEGGVGPQTTQALKNIVAVVEEAGGNVHHIIELKVFLKDSNAGMQSIRQQERGGARKAFGEAYERFFADRGRWKGHGNFPARTMHWVPEVPLEYPEEDTLVEITAVAVIPTILSYRAAL